MKKKRPEKKKTVSFENGQTRKDAQDISGISQGKKRTVRNVSILRDVIGYAL